MFPCRKLKNKSKYAHQIEIIFFFSFCNSLSCLDSSAYIAKFSALWLLPFSVMIPMKKWSYPSLGIVLGYLMLSVSCFGHYFWQYCMRDQVLLSRCLKQYRKSNILKAVQGTHSLFILQKQTEVSPKIRPFFCWVWGLLQHGKQFSAR